MYNITCQLMYICVSLYFTITHPGTLDLKAAMLQQGKPRVLSKQTGPILSPGDRRFWVP